MLRKRGFTLLEVMVSALLIMVGLGALGVTVVAGKRFLKQAEYRSQAMSLASSKMSEFSARGYSVLNDTTLSNQTGSYDWTASVVTQNATSIKTIPYKNITVVVSYQEEDGSGGLDTKNIRLTNIVPYPRVHSQYKYLSTDSGALVPGGDPDDYDDYEVVGNTDILSIDINFEVEKDILVMYTVAVNVEDNLVDKLDSLDTIYSTCFLDGAQETSLIARTPIITQPTFSHMVKLYDVASGAHSIEIRWLKDTDAGNISLREASLSMIATESD